MLATAHMPAVEKCKVYFTQNYYFTFFVWVENLVIHHTGGM